MAAHRVYGDTIWTDGLIHIDGRWVDREEYESRTDFYEAACIERNAGCSWHGIAAIALVAGLVIGLLMLAH